MKFDPFDPNDWLGRHPKICAIGMILCLLLVAYLEDVPK